MHSAWKYKSRTHSESILTIFEIERVKELLPFFTSELVWGKEGAWQLKEGRLHDVRLQLPDEDNLFNRRTGVLDDAWWHLIDDFSDFFEAAAHFFEVRIISETPAKLMDMCRCFDWKNFYAKGDAGGDQLAAFKRVVSWAKTDGKKPLPSVPVQPCLFVFTLFYLILSSLAKRPH